MPSKPVDVVDPIVERLRALAQDSPGLKDAAQFYEAILPLLRSADLCAAPVSMTPDKARARMEMGLPLLHDLGLELDGQGVRELMIQLARALETQGERVGPQKRRMGGARWWQKPDSAAHRIRLALEENSLNVGDLLADIAAGERGSVTSVAQSLQLDPGLLWTLAHHALKPALHAWCRQLTPLTEGIPWHRGSCFVCGAVATLGELQGNNLVKHVRCGCCGADWLFRRLRCLYCGNEDHHTLSYLYAEGRHEKMRVEVCDKCKGYLKIIAAYTPTPPEMLPVEDLATLHLDYIALERGYARVAVR